jgi:hypothetical protein
MALKRIAGRHRSGQPGLAALPELLEEGDRRWAIAWAVRSLAVDPFEDAVEEIHRDVGQALDVWAAELCCRRDGEFPV